MEYIHSHFILQALQYNLQKATYQPFCQELRCPPLLYWHSIYHCQHQSKKQRLTLGKTWQKSVVVNAMALLSLLLPMQTPILSSAQDLSLAQSSLEKIQITKTLNVATTFDYIFTHDQHLHGFGYDVASRYADSLGTRLNIITYPNDTDALNALWLGTADIVIANRRVHPDTVSAALDCQQGTANHFGLDDTHFIFHKHNLQLIAHATQYLCRPEVVSDTKAMAQFYQTHLLSDYRGFYFNKILKERLPLYEQSFKQAADTYQHDWRLLVAIAYQESHLNPVAVSPTGVQGIMMLTQDTSAEMGVGDRTNAAESIAGGAKYLQKLNAQFGNIPNNERLWFVLAAYNMGPYTVIAIQNEIKEAGGNPNLWSNFYNYLSDHATENSRYDQCMHYVMGVRTYFEALKAPFQSSSQKAA